MLLLKECKQILRSIIYFVFIGIVIAFYVTQFEGYQDDIRAAQNPNAVYDFRNPLQKPPEGLESYGVKSAEIPEQVVPNAITALLQEMQGGKFVTYPVGFYKTVRLNDKELSKIQDILEEITGLSYSDLVQKLMQEEQQKLTMSQDGGWIMSEPIQIEITSQVSYEQFCEKMGQVDKILGGGSDYAPANLKGFGSESITYEEALKQFESAKNQDNVTGGYARLFCDYMGIVLALFSVFIPVSNLMRDRKADMLEVIYSRKISSTRFICTRYIANTIMILLPVLLLSFIPLVSLSVYGAEAHLSVDYLAFVKYIFAWLLPTVMITVSVGFLFTILTDTPLGILVGFIWGFLSIFTGKLSGDYGFRMLIRHNSTIGRDIIDTAMNEIIFNRVFYVVIAIFILLISVWIYEKKRRGCIDIGGNLRKILGRIKGTN